MNRQSAKNQPLDQLGNALLVVAALASVFFAWLKIAHGVAYLGPIPTLAFSVVPVIGACWIWTWPRRRRGTKHLQMLIVATAFTLLIVVGVSVLHAAGLD